MKEWVRLTTTVDAAKPVLAMKNVLFDRAGVPNFPGDLIAANYFAIKKKNTR